MNKHLGPVFNTTLGPVFNINPPKSWTSFDSTAHIYIYTHIHEESTHSWGVLMESEVSKKPPGQGQEELALWAFPVAPRHALSSGTRWEGAKNGEQETKRLPKATPPKVILDPNPRTRFPSPVWRKVWRGPDQPYFWNLDVSNRAVPITD